MTTGSKAHRARLPDKAAFQVRFEDIREPGTYISEGTGHLIRIPRAAVQFARSRLPEIRGHKPTLVTQLSDDPHLRISQARRIAADLGLEPNF